jgi:hypothetical protein
LLVSHTYVVPSNIKQGQGLLSFFMPNHGFLWHFLLLTIRVSDKINASCILREFLSELFYFDNSLINVFLIFCHHELSVETVRIYTQCFCSPIRRLRSIYSFVLINVGDAFISRQKIILQVNSFDVILNSLIIIPWSADNISISKSQLITIFMFAHHFFVPFDSFLKNLILKF